MFCVIQEIRRKKPDPYGEPLEIRAYQNQWRLDETKPYTWAWEYSEERFERPRLDAYRISLHQSYREGGTVKKRQYAVCTMSYYDLCNSWWGEFIIGGEKALAEKVGMDPAGLYEIIETKLEPLRERLEAEFHQSPEYIAMQEHRRILDAHRSARSAFCNKYDVDGDEYDRCYDVFGMLRNKDYLEKLKAEHKARKKAEQDRWRSYRDAWNSTYSGGGSSSYSIPCSSTYTEDETAMLQKFYRTLTKKYHPDVNREADATAAMQLLNKLKETWGI